MPLLRSRMPWNDLFAFEQRTSKLSNNEIASEIMPVTDLQGLLAEQLKDLFSAETQIQEAYAQWSDAATSDELKSLLQEHQTKSKLHKDRIAEICSELGVEPTGHTCHGMKGLVQEGQEFLQEVEGTAVKDAGLIAMAQRIEHYGVAGYGCARTYALQLDLADTAEGLQQTLEEEAQLDERMTRLAEEVLNPEAASA